eukprot:gene13709-biopygen3120
MALRYGATLWRYATALRYGATLWRCAMALRYGAALWRFAMALRYGTTLSTFGDTRSRGIRLFGPQKVEEFLDFWAPEKSDS